MTDHPVTGLTRRGLLISAAAAPALVAARPATAAEAEPTVTEALRLRRSTRSFADRAIPPALTAELLWAAGGVNRPETGLRTAPSSHGAADTLLHVATADGVGLYDPDADMVATRLTQDIRPRLSPQPFVATAPVCLIHISDTRRLTAAEGDDEKRHWAAVNAAIVAQNVYLFAAARGLGTCLVGGLDAAAISEALALAPHEVAIYVQPIGWPA